MKKPAPTRPIPELAAIAKERAFKALQTGGLKPVASPTPEAERALQALKEALRELTTAMR